MRHRSRVRREPERKGNVRVGRAEYHPEGGVRPPEGHRMGQNAHWSRPMGRRRHGGDLVGRCDAQDGAITAVAPRKKTPKVRETEFEFREREAGRSLRVILTEENIWNG